MCSQFLPSQSIWACDWSQESVILTGSLDGTVSSWEPGKVLKKHQSSSPQLVGVTSVIATKDRRRAIASYQDGTIRFFDLNEEEKDLSEENSSLTEAFCIDPGLMEAWTISLSPDEDVLVSGTHRGSINIWSMGDNFGEKVASLDTHNKFILSTAFSCDKKLATTGIDGWLNVFDMTTAQNIQKVEAHALPTRSISFSPDGNLIYTASDDRHVSVYDSVSGTFVSSFSHTGMAYCVDASPDHRHFAVACANHSVVLWDLGMQRQVNTFSDQHSDQVWGVAFDKADSTGKRFASVGDDALIQLYE